jgi:hypothetical protein
MWDDTRLVVETITGWVDAHVEEPKAPNLELLGEAAR